MLESVTQPCGKAPPQTSHNLFYKVTRNEAITRKPAAFFHEDFYFRQIITSKPNGCLDSVCLAAPFHRINILYFSQEFLESFKF